MPELPEVETTRRGISPHIIQQKVRGVTIRDGRLRWPVPAGLNHALKGKTVLDVTRRGKYILIHFPHGTAILHLGMSGSLRIVQADAAHARHDHVDIEFDTGQVLRLHDPRRFGCLLWTGADPHEHPLLKDLGPEPLLKDFTGVYLFERSRGRTQAVKTFIMDSHTVAGVGNIYSSEALFLAGIHPMARSGRISLPRYNDLALGIKQTLARSIKKGGTTLRDYTGSDGNPGYFQQRLNVYGRESLPCRKCLRPIRYSQQGQRATYYCPVCQH
jgi:formamidopyrimidine-DNA glycosylase